MASGRQRCSLAASSAGAVDPHTGWGPPMPLGGVIVAVPPIATGSVRPGAAAVGPPGSRVLDRALPPPIPVRPPVPSPQRSCRASSRTLGPSISVRPPARSRRRRHRAFGRTFAPPTLLEAAQLHQRPRRLLRGSQRGSRRRLFGRTPRRRRDLEGLQWPRRSCRGPLARTGSQRREGLRMITVCSCAAAPPCGVAVCWQAVTA